MGEAEGVDLGYLYHFIFARLGPRAVIWWPGKDTSDTKEAGEEGANTDWPGRNGRRPGRWDE